MATLFKECTYRVQGGGRPVIKEHLPAATTIKKGDFVGFSSNSVSLLLAANTTYGSADVDTAGANVIYGMALADSVSTSRPIPVVLCNDHTEFLLPVLHGTLASAVTATSQVGAAYDLAHFDTGSVTAWGVTIDDTTGTNVVVTELPSIYPVGEQYGRVWAKIISGSKDIAVA